MTSRMLVIALALAGVALAGCGRLGDLERPGAPTTKSSTNATVMDPALDTRTPREAPIPGSNPH
ncbi:MAG: lipoprotein [Caulobacter sp.]|nr:lipoprotein [Caulobacter sp.]